MLNVSNFSSWKSNLHFISLAQLHSRVALLDLMRAKPFFAREDTIIIWLSDFQDLSSAHAHPNIQIISTDCPNINRMAGLISFSFASWAALIGLWNILLLHKRRLVAMERIFDSNVTNCNAFMNQKSNVSTSSAQFVICQANSIH